MIAKIGSFVLSIVSLCSFVSFLVLAQDNSAFKPKLPNSIPADEAATVELAEKILDLRTFPRLDGSPGDVINNLGMVMYMGTGTVQSAYEFQRDNLRKRGFQELAGSYRTDQSWSGAFTKDRFYVAVSASAFNDDPTKTNQISISLVNHGNIVLDKLPVPSNTKLVFNRPESIAYTAMGSVEDTAVACEKVLRADGWEPYGRIDGGPNGFESVMLYFKKNAIRLLAWVSIAPAQDNKTMIRYSSELLSSDLPAIHELQDELRYADSEKALSFAASLDRIEYVMNFYIERLTASGWKATTEKPVVDEDRRTRFLVFRNDRQAMISLDTREYNDKFEVALKHRSAAEVAAQEKLAKEAAELARLEREKKAIKTTIEFPLPEGSKLLKSNEENAIEFAVKTGSGPVILASLRDHFQKQGWVPEPGSSMDKTSGSVALEKGSIRLRMNYFDIGFQQAEFTVSVPTGTILKSVAGKEAASHETASSTTTTIPKKNNNQLIPGLPPGVQLPPEAADLIQKAIEQSKTK